jgi:hypothetical protein
MAKGGHKSQMGAAEAPGPAAGYVFQLRYALFRALERLKRDPTGAIAIEKIDDVVLLDAGGAPTELNQLKHVTAQGASLTDASKPLWRTLGNWARLIVSGDLNLTRLELLLVTNASVPENAALADIGADEGSRDVEKAAEGLREVAKNSDNQETRKDREIFLGLSDAEQIALLRSLRVVWESPGVGAISSELDASLTFACEAGQLAELRHELEGWWIDQISSQLEKGTGATLQLSALDARISFLREKYKPTTLTFDQDEPDGNPADLAGHTFVEQMRFVGAGAARLANAQRVFMRASAQRSRWLRQAKIDPDELTRYDDDLVDRWQTHSAICWDELHESSDENDRKQSGRNLLAWAESQETPLKGASAGFLTSGSFHALSDLVRVGWHPEYEKKFKPK